MFRTCVCAVCRHCDDVYAWWAAVMMVYVGMRVRAWIIVMVVISVISSEIRAFGGCLGTRRR